MPHAHCNSQASLNAWRTCWLPRVIIGRPHILRLIDAQRLLHGARYNINASSQSSNALRTHRAIAGPLVCLRSCRLSPSPVWFPPPQRLLSRLITFIIALTRCGRRLWFLARVNGSRVVARSVLRFIGTAWLLRYVRTLNSMRSS